MKEKTKKDILGVGAYGLVSLALLYYMALEETQANKRALEKKAAPQPSHEQIIDTLAPHGDITKGEAIQIFDCRDKQKKAFSVPR